MSDGAVDASLAYDDEGSGVPVLLLHGLTFDRTSWRPIIERLGRGVRTIAIDLPGHGETAGSPRSLPDLAAAVHDLAFALGIDRPIVIGHSMSASIASIYGASYPTLGVVNVDQPLDIRPFAQLLRQIWPALSGPGFSSTFQRFQQSLGLENVPEPRRSRILDSQTIRPELVLGYWDQAKSTDPDQLHSQFSEALRQITCPYLAVFGRPLTTQDRAYMADHLRGLQLTEWPDSGHFVHLVDVDRFTERLRTFIDFCAASSAGPPAGSVTAAGVGE